MSTINITKQAVWSGYRRLFRARKKLFEGDVRAMRESRIAIKSEFIKNKNVTDASHLNGLFVMIDEAEDMLLHGIARGELNSKTGHYEVKIKPEHTSSSVDKDTMTHMEPITSETNAEEIGLRGSGKCSSSSTSSNKLGDVVVNTSINSKQK